MEGPPRPQWAAPPVDYGREGQLSTYRGRLGEGLHIYLIVPVDVYSGAKQEKYLLACEWKLNKYYGIERRGETPVTIYGLEGYIDVRQKGCSSAPGREVRERGIIVEITWAERNRISSRIVYAAESCDAPKTPGIETAGDKAGDEKEQAWSYSNDFNANWQRECRELTLKGTHIGEDATTKREVYGKKCPFIFLGS